MRQRGLSSFVAAMLPIVFASAAAFSQVIYVKWDATGANNGLSWANAYNTLYDAIDSANYGDEIWVAQGQYTPSDPLWSEPWDSLILQPGVSLYGGFGGTETSRSQRLPASRLTILTGVLDGDNSYHVLYAYGDMESATVDGFTITGGVADGTDEAGAGGGFFGEYVENLAFSNCHFTVNAAIDSGAAVYLCDDSYDVYFDNCLFSLNTNGDLDGLPGPFSSSGGGAVALYYYSFAEFYSCEFSENSAYEGGAIYLMDSSADLYDCVLKKNIAENNGGAIALDYDWDGSYVYISGSTLTDNTAICGGAIYSEYSEISIDYSTLSKNIASEVGGAVYFYDSYAWFSATTFTGNRSTDAGGAVYFDQNENYKSASFYYCRFIENISDYGGAVHAYYTDSYGFSTYGCQFKTNSANYEGGALYLDDIDYSYFENNTFYGNSAGDAGGAVASNYSDFYFTNSVFYNNSADYGGAVSAYESELGFQSCTLTKNGTAQVDGYDCYIWANSSIIWDPNTTTLPVTTIDNYFEAYYCDISGVGVYPGDGNINADPLFINPTGTTPNLRLSPSPASPCIDAADGWSSYYSDIEGNERYDHLQVVDTGDGDITYVDMGAYEYALYSINGRVTIAGTSTGLQNAIVTLSGAVARNVTVGTSGVFEFGELANQTSYTVTAAAYGYTLSPASQAVSIDFGSWYDVDFTGVATPRYRLSGRVRPTGVTTSTVGMVLQLLWNGQVVDVVVLDETGNYVFNVPAGSYTFGYVLDGVQLTEKNIVKAVSTITVIDRNRSYNFTPFLIDTTVSYVVTPMLGSPEGGTISPAVPVSVYHGDTTTFIVTIDDGYMLDRFRVDGEIDTVNYKAVGVNQYAFTFTSVSSDHDLVAVFETSESGVGGGQPGRCAATTAREASVQISAAILIALAAAGLRRSARRRV